MTIAMGLLAKDGLVFAADSEVTYAGALKGKATKIWSALAAAQRDGETVSRCLLASGAGTGPYLDALSQQLCDVVGQGETLPDAAIEERIRSTLISFHAAHVLPFAAYPYDDRPGFQLLIGVQLPKPRLFTSCENVLVETPPQRPYVAVGAGITVAMPLLERFYATPIPDVRTAILITAYVMYHTKESVPSCGKATEILGFHNDRIFELKADVVERLEKAIHFYSACSEPTRLREVGGDHGGLSSIVAAEAQKDLEKMVAALNLGL